MLPAVVLDDERLMVDVELWTLITELAVNGAQGLEASLWAISSRWWEFNGNSVAVKVDRASLPTKELWQEQLAANRRLGKSSRRRSIVSDRIGWYQRCEGGCISPNDIEGEWWEALCAFESKGKHSLFI